MITFRRIGSEMSARSFLALAAAALVLLAPVAKAANSAQPLTPQAVSVAGGESQVFSVRFFDALGHAAVGETVHFTNDACGRFSNGGFAMDVVTDATGMASATFTASIPGGITCHVLASAGVAVRFDVITYQTNQTQLAVSIVPATPRPAQPYTLVVSPMMGVFKLYNVDVSARVIPGTASASITPGPLSTGDSGAAEFLVTPDNRIGDYAIEVQFRTMSGRLSMGAAPDPWQDMWWSGRAENGWGMSIVQHNDMLFSVIYAYDGAGKPTWYVIPGGTWNESHTTFSGAVYVPRGTPYSAYDTTRFVPGAPVGNVSLNFTSLTDAVLDYTINGVSGRKNLTRQEFGAVDATIIAIAGDHGDMWWGGLAQNGWGLAILQQYRSLFGVWFTYDESGAPTWFVMPAGFWSDSSTFEGHIYRTTGSPWLGRAYDAAALQVIDVGTFRMRFASEGATFEYTIEGRSGSMALTRQSF